MADQARSLLVVAMAVVTFGAACGDDGGGEGDAASETTVTSAATTSEAPVASVSFTEPADGATVTSPVKVKMQATNFTIEPAGEIKPGSGHFHIIVDGGCTTAGAVIGKDETRLHYGMAQTEAELPLAAGQHTLCLQAGDGAHTALDLTDTITITVSG